jgi:hypothetical protein
MYKILNKMMCCKLKLLRPDVLMQFSKKQDQNTVKQFISPIFILAKGKKIPAINNRLVS